MNILHILKHNNHPEGKAETDEPHAALELPDAEFASSLMNDPSFVNYVQHNGYHFTDKLADFVTSHMVNANGQDHNWTCEKIKQYMFQKKIALPDVATIGDITFLANMAYADFYPEITKEEADCLKYAFAVVKDPDGYEGIAFYRWLSDVVGKKMNIPWGDVA